MRGTEGRATVENNKGTDSATKQNDSPNDKATNYLSRLGVPGREWNIPPAPWCGVEYPERVPPIEGKRPGRQPGEASGVPGRELCRDCVESL